MKHYRFCLNSLSLWYNKKWEGKCRITSSFTSCRFNLYYSEQIIWIHASMSLSSKKKEKNCSDAELEPVLAILRSTCRFTIHVITINKMFLIICYKYIKTILEKIFKLTQGHCLLLSNSLKHIPDWFCFSVIAHSQILLYRMPQISTVNKH